MSALSQLTDVYLQVDGGTALSTDLIDRVNRVCDDVEDSTKDVTVLVLLEAAQGGPSADPWPHNLGVHTINKWEQALRRFERLPALTFAVVHGVCRGPALDLLLTTDFRIGTPNATLRIPPAARATWPGMALYRMANQLGVGRSRQLALLGREASAAQAVVWGLLDEVAADTVQRSRDALIDFAGFSGKELAVRRQLLSEATSTSFEDAIGPHLAACDRALRLASSGPDSGPGIQVA
jgi:isomerase DpgB